MSGGDCGCGCGGAGGCGYGGAGSWGTAQLPWGVLGANPLIFPGETQVPINYTAPLVPGPQLSFAPTREAEFLPHLPLATIPLGDGRTAAAPAASSGPGIGTVLLAVGAIGLVGFAAWWSYKNSYSQRTAAARSERAQTSYRPRARRPSRRASRVNSRNNGALRQLSPARR